ncbi:hypothetical protein B0T20DRAFT_365344 [Sordaria brevicollis]|uniref:Uncharacterized protein n=1 Tax=Sordaria brevicollis TaxID=83679 RepID=A0AAE0U2C4_SORBR|nr:hypothetical protein B0T20DRAFT_365344 [Sordaria brevicollis]
MDPLTETLPFHSTTYQHEPSSGDIATANTEKSSQYLATSAWRPGIVRRFPIYGIVPLLLSTGLASAVVLLSNGTPVDGWWSGLRQPGVLLAYTSTIANALLGVAFAEATVVFFWTRAVAGRLMVGNLHYHWKGSTGIVGGIKSLRRRRAICVSIVSILVTITGLLRGPLIQRASYVQNVGIRISGNIKLPVLRDVEGFGGVTSGDKQVLRYSPEFSAAITDPTSKTPIEFTDANCQNCTLQVEAFGFQVVNCTVSSGNPYYIPSPSQAQMISRSSDEIAAFFKSKIEPGKLPSIQSTILISVERKDTQACVGMTTKQVCHLGPALVKYTLDVRGNFASFKYASWKDDSVIQLRYVKDVHRNSPKHCMYSTTILPFQLFGSKMWDSYSPGYYAPRPPYRTTTKDDLLPNIFCADPGYGDPCKEYYNDPMDYLINSYRELAFRMSVRAAIKNQTYQTVSYTSHLIEAQYTADRSALALAVVISLLGPLATFILFWNWWKLGRSFSMSPLELANAILPQQLPDSERANDSPLSGIFADCSSNLAADKLARYVSWQENQDNRGNTERKLQYGVVESTGRLAFAFTDSGDVRTPKVGEEF